MCGKQEDKKLAIILCCVKWWPSSECDVMKQGASRPTCMTTDYPLPHLHLLSTAYPEAVSAEPSRNKRSLEDDDKDDDDDEEDDRLNPSRLTNRKNI